MNGLTVTDVRAHPGDSGFLLDDGRTAILYDSGFGFTGFAVAEKIRAVLGKRGLDYIFLSHSHYDHALGSASILEHYPDAVVVAGRHAADVFRRPGALKVMQELDGKIARRCGVEDSGFLGHRLRVDIAVADGDVIRAGDSTFEVLELPGHTRCSVGFHCREKALLLGSETMGVYDGADVIVPSCLVGYQASLDSIERVGKLHIKHILAPHFGLLDERQTSYYLDHAADALRDCAQFVAEQIRQGEPEETIAKRFMERYVRGPISSCYPEDAAALNTSIMIRLIGKEMPGFAE